MKQCFYCQSIIQNESDSFCCKSCELIWNWTHGQDIIKKDMTQTSMSDFDYLSHIEVEKKYRTQKDQRHFKFHIEGLNCVSCVHLLEELPQMIKGVLIARLDFSESSLYVELDDTLSLPYLCAQLVELGYRPTLLESNDDLQVAQKIENRQDLKRIALAGAITGNIMLFTVPLYGGLDGDTATIFKWISFTLFLPLIFYSSKPFYRNALQALQKRMINVDITIVVALWLGFLLSTWNLLNNRDELYFDSTASFIFLILSSRFYMKKIQQKFLIKNILNHLFQKELYFNVSQNKQVSADQIKVGELVVVQAGHLIPCDGVLVSESAELDLSYLTGESWPEKIDKNAKVFAGARLLNSEMTMQVEEPSSKSHLGELVKKIESMSSVADRYKTETDFAAHWLTLSVLAIAAVFFVFYFQTNPWGAFQRSLALLIVACPCAIAFGTPLALSLGMKKAYQNGFFIRSESFFERLLSVKNIILDKTGTLTDSKLKLIRTMPPHLDFQMQSLILAAEAQSRHPVAQSLRQEWVLTDNHRSKNILVSDVKNIPGSGVEAIFTQENNSDGKRHTLSVQKAKNSGLASGLIEVVVMVDSAPKAYLFFEERIREKTSDFVQKLYDLKYDTFILTGDLKNRALEFSKKFKIPSFRVFSEQTPEMKEQIIKSHNPTLYIGDGLNDLLALKAAHVSYAIEGQFDVTLSVADVYAPQKGPEGLLFLIDLGRQIQKTVRGNLFFALIYNLIAGGLALTGLMSPLLAAVLMPMSSTLILTHTMWRLR